MKVLSYPSIVIGRLQNITPPTIPSAAVERAKRIMASTLSTVICLRLFYDSLLNDSGERIHISHVSVQKRYPVMK